MERDLLERVRALGLEPADFTERFCRASGPGGQNVNKVSTAVEVRHRPSGLAARVQEGRTQGSNRREAWERLIARIREWRGAAAQAERQAREKRRRQSRQPPRAAKKRAVEGKRRRATVKAGRGRVAVSGD